MIKFILPGLMLAAFLYFVFRYKKEKVTYTATNTLKGTNFENTLLDLINDYRAEKGVESLLKDDEASRYAFSRVKDVIKEDKISHDNFKPSALNDLGYTTLGENLAYGYNTPEETFNAWIKSVGHRSNILNKKWKFSGLRAKRNSKGRIFVAHIFGR